MKLTTNLADNDVVSNLVTNFDRVKPGLGVIAGLVGIGVSTYLTWRAGRKHEELMAEIQADLEAVHAERPAEATDADTGETVNVVSESGLTMKQYNTKLAKTYLKSGWKLFKLYGPAFLLEAASVTSILGGFHIEHERHMGASAVAAIAMNGYNKYRKNVIDTLGKEADEEFRFGIKDRDIEMPELDKNGQQKVDKDGKPKTKKVRHRVLEDELSEYSEYARIFDRYHTDQFEYDKKTGIANDDYNRKFLLDTEDYFNHMLRYRTNHTVFLNEVYERLGYELTEAGQYVGWHYDKKNPVGDNRIEIVPIDIYNRDDMESIIVDFNVDGSVIQYLNPKFGTGTKQDMFDFPRAVIG